MRDCSNERLIEIEPAIFATQFNRKPFAVRHNLSTEPLLELDSVRELARSLETRPGELYADIDVTRVEQRWDESSRPEVSTASVIDDIAASNAWIIIRRAELDPRYRVLLERGMAEIRAASGGRLPQSLRKENAIIFVTSPRRISTYHIDRECNFILQIRGEKQIYIYDQNDREVLPEEELERFWAIDNNAATYKPQYQDRGQMFHLRPGDGVHVPVNAPHWVQNGDDISITLSLNFQFTDMERANKYRANYYLRKLGVDPAPPGKYPMRDMLKANAIRGAALLRRPLKVLARD
jgi:cupin-like protein